MLAIRATFEIERESGTWRDRHFADSGDAAWEAARKCAEDWVRHGLYITFGAGAEKEMRVVPPHKITSIHIYTLPAIPRYCKCAEGEQARRRLEPVKDEKGNTDAH